LCQIKFTAKKRHLQIESASFDSRNGAGTACKVKKSPSPSQSKRMRSASAESVPSDCSLSLSVRSEINVIADDDDDDGSCSCDGHSSIGSDSASDTRSYSLHSSSSSSLSSPPAPTKSKSRRHADVGAAKSSRSRDERHKGRTTATTKKHRKRNEPRQTKRTAPISTISSSHVQTAKPIKSRNDSRRTTIAAEKRHDAPRPNTRPTYPTLSSDHPKSAQLDHHTHPANLHHDHNRHSDRFTDKGRRYLPIDAPNVHVRDGFADQIQQRSLPVDYESLLRHFFKDAAFFVMKSSNFDNIDLSKRLGVWSTRPANEQKLNQAFNQFRNVLLLFSVQESGHFQGFARLASPSMHDRPPVPWVLPAALNVNSLGGTFSLDWLNTNHLPFNRTLHLFNPMNEGKPVKVGRDGQQVEPRVGQELCRLFVSDFSSDLMPKLHRMRRQTSMRPSNSRSHAVESGMWHGNADGRRLISGPQPNLNFVG
jgi:hypothetical protein